MKKNKQNDNSNFKLNIKRTWRYIKKAKWSLIAFGIISIIEAVFSSIMPLLSAKVILNITNGLMKQLILSALAVFLISFVFWIFVYLKGVFYQKIYQKVLVNIQKSLAEEILNLEISEIDKHSSGLFINRLNNDTQDIAGIFLEYAYYLSYIITNIGVLITIFILNKYMFVYAIITSLVIYFVGSKRLDKQNRIRKNLKAMLEEKTGLTSELVRGMRDIKVLNASDTILNQVTNKIEGTTKEYVHMILIQNFFSYIEENIRILFDLGLIVLGCILYKHALLTIPAFIIIYNYQGRIKNLLTGVVKVGEFNKDFNLAADRIYEVIENKKFKKEKFGNKKIEKLNGNIKFKNVYFNYETTPVLKNMSFEIKPNQRVAFVGKSGAGKTTIFNLITKLYRNEKGKILLDDIDINDLTCSRDNMSIITQNPYIFNFSIKDNLLLAKKDATMEEIREACKLACIDDYIMSLENQYETKLGENGIILSGGQKQRIAIARALLMKTEIILFDEATSALDNETQSQIQKAIDNLKNEYTVLIIAHRLSTVIDSDTIFVVDDGKIIANGSHNELLKNCDYYKNLYYKDLEK